MSALAVLDPRAAFVDVGSERMHVSIGGGPPRVFGAVTSQLQALRDFLVEGQVRSVAMEATGVYWLPLYGVLEAAGLDVRMVDGRQTRHLPGRKSDMQDCQWGATLHAHGLLRAGFVPPAHVRRLQDYLRLRGEHVAAAAGHVQHMQKALERMNIKLHDVISSLTGVSGLAVVRAILAGERDAAALLELCDVRIRRAKAERVVEALRGNWADEHLFALGQAVQSWDHYQAQIVDCDRRIAETLARMPGGDAPAAAVEKPAKRRTQPGVNAPGISNLRELAPAHVRRQGCDHAARPQRIYSPAACRGSRHGSDQVADREALRVMARARAGQRPERQAQNRGQATPQPCRANILCDGPRPGAQQIYRPRRLLPTDGRATRRPGRQQGPGAQARHPLLARHGQGHGLRRKGACPL
jgi:hypothetical protein